MQSYAYYAIKKKETINHLLVGCVFRLPVLVLHSPMKWSGDHGAPNLMITRSRIGGAGFPL
jgi:hypothetical protein